MIVSVIINSIAQVFLFTLIPLIVFLIKFKTYKGFFNYIGLYPAGQKSVVMAVIVSALFSLGVMLLVVMNASVREAMLAPNTVTGSLRGLQNISEKIAVLLIISCIRTAFAEEIFFRGFVAKRLITRLGFSTGNFIQALLFGLVHVALFMALTRADPFFLLISFLIPGIVGYLIGYINEKMANGSIIPGWIAHALGNIIANSVLVFLI
jgi:CAAX protease family protein